MIRSTTSQIKRRHKPRFKIRKASLKDLDLLVKHRREMFRDMGRKNLQALNRQDATYRAWARRRLKSLELVGFIAATRKEVAASGCVWIQPKQPIVSTPLLCLPYLLSVYTEPKFRRLGLASQITSHAIAWCKKHRYPGIALHASDQGRGVYEKLGFERTWEMLLTIK
jgi:GNAT superfamily N-acetyltransferase